MKRLISFLLFSIFRINKSDNGNDYSIYRTLVISSLELDSKEAVTKTISLLPRNFPRKQKYSKLMVCSNNNGFNCNINSCTGTIQYTVVENSKNISVYSSSSCSSQEFNLTTLELEITAFCVSEVCNTANFPLYLSIFADAENNEDNNNEDNEGGTVAGVVVAIFIFTTILALCVCLRYARRQEATYYAPPTGPIILPPPQYTQPYGGNPYEGNPYGGNPYGAQPQPGMYGAQPDTQTATYPPGGTIAMARVVTVNGQPLPKG